MQRTRPQKPRFEAGCFPDGTTLAHVARIDRPVRGDTGMAGGRRVVA